MGNKNTEQNCLDIVKKCSAIGDFAKSVKQLFMADCSQEERPDFLFDGGSVGVEHFLADVIFGVKHKNAQSIERKNSSNIVKKIDYYHQHQDELVKDIENGKAPKFIEDIINSEINGVSKFAYIDFINNFMKVYNEHYANRSVYRSKCEKLGFLIELPYPHSLSSYYIVSKNNYIRKQSIKTLPLTTDMLDFIQNHADLDFVVLCIRPIHSSSNKKGCKTIYIDPKNVYKSVKEQDVFVCDSFDYPHKFSNTGVAKLNVESSTIDSVSG